MSFTLDELLLNIKALSFNNLVCQTDIQTEKDKEAYLEKGYFVDFTEQEFTKNFSLNPSCVWYTTSVSDSCLYFNPESLAAAPFPIKFFTSGLLSKVDQFYEAIRSVEAAVQVDDHDTSILALPDAMRMEYFNYLVEKKGPDFPGLYHLFMSHYCSSDYGFGNITSETLAAILNSKTISDHEITSEQLQDLPDKLRIFRGANSKSTPLDCAYSWSLDINVANFFACRRGNTEGCIIEAEIDKKDVIEAFLLDRNEAEILVHPKDVKVVSKIPTLGLEYLKEILPQITPMYQTYRSELECLDFAQDSEIHGFAHESRVLLMCLTIAHILDLPARDRKVLAAAAVYHDAKREDDEIDSLHGKKGREYYHDFVSSPDPLVEFLCEYHCRPDEEAYHEIRTNRALSKNRTRSKLLFDVFKDADALDRVRFGIRGLDLNQLRLPVSRELILVARLFYEHLEKGGVRKIRRKPTLSTQIQSASAKAKENADTKNTSIHHER